MQTLISADRIQVRVRELAQEIAVAYQGAPVTIVGVLTGCVVFMADLIRHLDLPIRLAFIQASSYRGAVTSAGELHVRSDWLPDLKGRHVLLMDDILDTGKTLNRLADEIRALQVASLRVAVLTRKRGRQELPLEPDFCGFEIPDVFVVGYGLDFNDEYRHLPYLGILTEPASS